MFKFIISCMAGLFFMSHVQAQSSLDIELKSNAQRAYLVELYTSEGCSSCPPADAFLATLKNSPLLWKQYVPIAMHVDYWDYIGWKDPYAQAQNSARQRKYSQQGAVKSVYTPGFVVDGKEWRGFFAKQALPKPTKNNGDKDSAYLLNVAIKDKKISASFEISKASEAQSLIYKNANNWRLHIALLGMDIAQPIARGENANKTLKHDFVMLAHQQIDAHQPQWNTSLNSNFDIQAYQKKNIKKFAVVTWVSVDEIQAPLQATGAYLKLP